MPPPPHPLKFFLGTRSEKSEIHVRRSARGPQVRKHAQELVPAIAAAATAFIHEITVERSDFETGEVDAANRIRLCKLVLAVCSLDQLCRRGDIDGLTRSAPEQNLRDRCS